MTLIVSITRADLLPLRPELARVWSEVEPDCGRCSKIDAAELILDRVTGETAREIDRLTEVFGYLAVRKMTAQVLFI